MVTRIDDGHQNELIVITDASRFSQSELDEIHSQIAEIARDTQLVPQYRMEYESDSTSFRTYVFSTKQPDKLYSQLRCHLLESERFRSRIFDSTWARWTGEDTFLDSIWVHRQPSPVRDQLDGLENRVACIDCGLFFWRGHAEEDGKCPYCEHFDSSLLKSDT